jgi:hypothetical protein
MKPIVTVVNTKQKVPVTLMRELVRPLFPPDHSLDAKFLYNFGMKAKKVLTMKADGDEHRTAPTDDEETQFRNVDLPDYFSKSFQVFELAKTAELELTDVEQIETFLESLAQADPSFKYRRSTNANGDVTGYIWQKGVMRRDFELYGSTLFVDRLGRPLNNKGWPLMTMAMISGDKRVCIASEAIVFFQKPSAHMPG